MTLSLGIDIGTTKTALVIVDASTGDLLEAVSRSHEADVSGLPESFREQSVERHLGTIYELFQELSPEHLKAIQSIGITGQMHSVMLWKGAETSNLITWQDQRASQTNDLHKFTKKSALPLRDGFGGTTLAWLAKQGTLNGWKYATTFQDYLAATLCGLEVPNIDPTHAASWGIYNTGTNQWHHSALEKLGIPKHILPTIVPCGSIIGNTTSETATKHGISEGVAITAPIGDNQASVLSAAFSHPNEKSTNILDETIFITLGTGAQLSLVIDASNYARFADLETVELRPFPDGKLMAVAAPLCGGRAFSWLGDVVEQFLSAFGFVPPAKNAILDHLDELALGSSEKSGLQVTPRFLGERHQPNAKGSITGITLDNLTPANLALATANGVISNLHDMFPQDAFAGRRQVIGSGNGVRKVKSIQQAIEHIFDLPLTLSEAQEEAARGAAILAGRKTGVSDA